MNDEIVVRPAALADIADLVLLRRMMFESMGEKDTQKLDAGDAAAAAYFAETIPSGEFYGWVAVTSAGQVVGSGGAVIDRHPPGPGNLSGRIGYIMNIAVASEYRRRGIARQIMQTILDWLLAHGVTRMSLHASDMGRPLYEKLGFKATNEMRLNL